MASKVHTDNPKHHSYVCVNKRERKKIKRIGAKPPLLTLLAREILYLWEHMPCGGRWHYNCGSYIPKGTLIIWDDCNHKSYRKLKRRSNGTWDIVYEWGNYKPRHFKKPMNNEY